MKSRLSVALHGVSVRRGSTWALRDITVSLKAGERWALIGDNGAGKTQLLKLLATDVWPTPTGQEKRAYRIGRRPADLKDAKERIAYVGAELQDKYARYGWNPTVHDLLITGIHRTDLLLRAASAEEEVRTAAMLTACRLKPLGRRRFLSLSYGQKRLALLARALVQAPDWLFLDEFYNGLDRHFRAEIDAVLDAARRAGQSWVVSAHRAADVPPGTDRLLELRAGRVHAVSKLRAQDLTRLAAKADEKSHRPTAAAARQSAVAPRRASREWLVRITGADVYVDYRPVLRELDWELRVGEHWAVFGANGAGKSTFLKLLYGDLSPALGGHIERAGFSGGSPIAEWKKQVGLVSPELQTDYALDVTVQELVASGRHASIGLVDAPTAADLAAARRWLKFFSLLTVANRRPRELSYGQLRRALIARALAGNARLLLLDEPLTGLDPRQRAGIKRLLERLMKRHLTVVIAVHHAEDLPRGIMRGLHLSKQRARMVDRQSET